MKVLVTINIMTVFIFPVAVILYCKPNPGTDKDFSFCGRPWGGIVSRAFGQCLVLPVEFVINKCLTRVCVFNLVKRLKVQLVDQCFSVLTR